MSTTKKFKFYTEEENAMILGSTASQDKEIATKLGRTPGAISVRRSALLREQGTAPMDHKGEDFTSAEQRRILSTSAKEDRNLATALKTTIASVKSMRRYLQKNGAEETKMAAAPATRKKYSHMEESTSDTHIMIKFGDSTMMLKKDEVSMVEVSVAGIMIIK